MTVLLKTKELSLDKQSNQPNKQPKWTKLSDPNPPPSLPRECLDRDDIVLWRDQFWSACDEFGQSEYRTKVQGDQLPILRNRFSQSEYRTKVKGDQLPILTKLETVSANQSAG